MNQREPMLKRLFPIMNRFQNIRKKEKKKDKKETKR